MRTPFELKTAAELFETGRFIAKWQARRELDPLPRAVLQKVVEQFVAGGGPVAIETVAARLAGHDLAQIYEAVTGLDEKDLLVLEEGRVTLAYPLSASPTAFRVVLLDGRERYAVCAVDALGVPAMLGQPVVIHSRCHHCREPLAISARPDGPVGSRDVMVWVGEGGDLRGKSCTSV